MKMVELKQNSTSFFLNHKTYLSSPTEALFCLLEEFSCFHILGKLDVSHKVIIFV